MKKREDETLEQLLRRFKKKVISDEVLLDCKRHEYYMSKKEIRKFKKENNPKK